MNNGTRAALPQHSSPNSNGLQGVPTSLQAGLNQVQHLLNQGQLASEEGNNELALIRAEQGMKVLRTLASSMPQYAAVLMAASAGFREIEEETMVVQEHFYPEDIRILGLKVGTCYQRDWQSTTTTKRIRLKP